MYHEMELMIVDLYFSLLWHLYVELVLCIFLVFITFLLCWCLLWQSVWC